MLLCDEETRETATCSRCRYPAACGRLALHGGRINKRQEWAEEIPVEQVIVLSLHALEGVVVRVERDCHLHSRRDGRQHWAASTAGGRLLIGCRPDSPGSDTGTQVRGCRDAALTSGGGIQTRHTVSCKHVNGAGDSGCAPVGCSCGCRSRQLRCSCQTPAVDRCRGRSVSSAAAVSSVRTQQ